MLRKCNWKIKKCLQRNINTLNTIFDKSSIFIHKILDIYIYIYILFQI